MNKTEMTKQLAEQGNKERLDSQASRLEKIRRGDAERLEELTEQMASLAEAMAAMTGETQSHLSAMERTVKRLSGEAESALSQARQAGDELRAASRRISWKVGTGMLLAAILAAPAAVSAYSLWQHHYGEEKAQAEAWRNFRAQLHSLTPAERDKLLKTLHWDQRK